MEKKNAWFWEDKESSKVHSSHKIHGYAFSESLCKLMDECFDGGGVCFCMILGLTDKTPVPIDAKVG